MRAGLDLIPWARVVSARDQAGKAVVLPDRQVVDTANWRPPARVAQDHAVVLGEVCHPDSRLSLGYAGGAEFTLDGEHRCTVQPRAVGPDYCAVAPEPDVRDPAFGDPARFVDKQCLVKARGRRDLTESALAPAPRVLEPGERPLEVLGQHRMRTHRHLLRSANCHDEPSPVPVDADACVRHAIERVTNARPDEISIKFPAIDLTVRASQPGQVKVKTARPAVADLHGREVSPAFMVEEGRDLLIGIVAVDFHPEHFGEHRK